MLEYFKGWMELKTDRRAVTALEYGLVASLIALAIITALTVLGTKLSGTFTNVTNNLK